MDAKEYHKNCILGYSNFQLADRPMLEYLTRTEDEGLCDSTVACDAERLRWISLDLNDDDMDPLYDGNLDSRDNFSVCTTCFAAAKDSYLNARQKLWPTLWDDLPRVFELGTWEDLLPR